MSGRGGGKRGRARAAVEDEERGRERGDKKKVLSRVRRQKTFSISSNRVLLSLSLSPLRPATRSYQLRFVLRLRDLPLVRSPLPASPDLLLKQEHSTLLRPKLSQFRHFASTFPLPRKGKRHLALLPMLRVGPSAKVETHKLA